MEYKYFKLTLKQNIISISCIIIGVLLVSKMFYGNFWMGIIISPIGYVIYRTIKKKIYNRQLRKMELQFRDMLMAVSDLMQTGYSIENAFLESYKEIVQIYGKNSMIGKEMRLINSRLKLNVNIEKVIADFADRYDIDSIKTFYQTFSIAKRTGGNMREIIKNVCETISLKEKIKEEIKVSMNAKRLEQKVMMGIPIFIMMYVTFASPGFLDVMHETILGNFIMTVCLGAYVGAYVWGEKIIDVEM